MQMEIIGIESLIKKLKRITDEKNTDLVLRDLTKDTAKLAYDYCPEDTGKMENQIHVHKISNIEYEIICNVPYAVHNEYGTYKMDVGTVDNPLDVISASGKRAYRPFMRPAVFQKLKELPVYVKKYLFSESGIISGD